MEQMLDKIAIGLSAIIGILLWVYRDNLNQLRERFIILEAKAAEDKKELERKYEKLDMQIRSIEDEKFTDIMKELGMINTRIAVIEEIIKKNNK